MLAQRVARRILTVRVALPGIIERAIDELLDAAVEPGQIGGDKLAIDDGARCRPALLAPTVAIFIGRVVIVLVIPLTEVDHVRRGAAKLSKGRVAPIEEVENVVPNPRAALGVIDEGPELSYEGIELFHAKCERDAAWADRFGMRIFSAEQDIGRARRPHHTERFDKELAGTPVQVRHDGADGRVAVNRGMSGRGTLRPGPDLGIGGL